MRSPSLAPVYCLRLAVADAIAFAYPSEGFDAKGGLLRREVASAARKMPKIAPRVPPISSTLDMVEYRMSKMEPLFATPESRLVMIADYTLMKSF